MPASIIAQLEESIGLASGSRSLEDARSLQARLALPDPSSRLRNNIRLWLVEKGIPLKASNKSGAHSLAQAYVKPDYLKGWLRNIAPSTALLDDIENSTLPADLPPPPDGAAEPSPMPGQFNNGPTEQEIAAAQPKPLGAEFSPTFRKDLLEEAEARAKVLVDEKMDSIRLSQATKDMLRDLATAAARDEIANNTVKQIEIVQGPGAKPISLGIQHMLFPKLLRAVQARDHRNFHLNIWLTGPTGSGKTTAAEAVSKALSLPFGSDGSLDADYKVLGFRDANGNIVSTQFLDIYKNGGIYVADEIDVWMPSALLSLNAALANGWCSSPSGLVQRHPDACVIACANTWGLGATNDYVGRAKLDGASLDRFHPKIDWPYDERLERAIANASGGQLGDRWCDIVLGARHAARRQGLKIIVSPRSTFCGIALLQQSFPVEEVADYTFLAGLTPEQKKALAIDFSGFAQSKVA